ncbi:hypothetical protein D3C86_1370630 [compost metagenome]
MLFAKADDVLAVHDRLPAELFLHALQKGRNAGFAEIGNGTVILAEKREFFVFGADAEIGFSFATACQIICKLRDGGEGCLVGRVACHGLPCYDVSVAARHMIGR